MSQASQTAGAGQAYRAPEQVAAQPPSPAPVAPDAPAASVPASQAASDSVHAALPHLPAEAADRIAKLVSAAPVAAPQATASSASETAPAPRVRPTPHRAELATALRAGRRGFFTIGMLSLVINVLMLTSPLFMLQVYDRVLASGSMPTLVALSGIAFAALSVMGLLDLIRSRIVTRLALDFDDRIGARVFDASIRRQAVGSGTGQSPLRELDHLRQFLSGNGPTAFCDAPWAPVYLAVLFLLHFWIGVAATVGAVVLLALAWMSEMRSRAPLRAATRTAARSVELAETAERNAGALTAMGMIRAFRRRWQTINADSLSWQVRASDRMATIGSASRTLRLLLQSAMLALGAALAVQGDISAGSIIAASILAGRAMSPVEQALGHWRGFTRAREAYGSLHALLEANPAAQPRTKLPAPTGRMDVSGLRVAAPGTQQLILANVGFSLTPGQVLAVIGPSASGKSTLVRALVGLWPAAGGSICLDGARLDQWDSEELGRHIGYLPQEVEIFAGTIRDNIARFDENASDEAVIAAARAARVHELVLALPKGYETEIGTFGAYLSAGQRQRVGLARALYGDPALVVLDEPNANLDRAGDEALAEAIDAVRARGGTVVIVSHRVQAIGKADVVLYLDRGLQRAFGPRADVLTAFQSHITTVSGGRRP